MNIKARILRGEVKTFVDTFTVQLTGGITYICYAGKQGISRDETGWAIQRVTEVTDPAGTVSTDLRWAKKSGISGIGAYFQYTANEYLDANGDMGN